MSGKDFYRYSPDEPLDLSSTKGVNVAATTPSALATARIISDISVIQYPEGVSSPRPELNEGAKEGKFRYDREFLLQFMPICKKKPAMLPPLDAIGLEPTDQIAMPRGGSGLHRQGSGPVPSRQGSIGLGFSPSTFAKGSTNPFSMGNFGTAGASKLSSEDRFAMSATAGRAASVSDTAGMQLGFTDCPTPVTHTVSQGGPGRAPLRERTRAKRGAGVRDLESVAPLQVTENRWIRKVIAADADSPEMVNRKVKALLNKLTTEKFDSISDQIISWVNKSEKEKDGHTLIQVIRLVFEHAIDDERWSEMFAHLCRKMMERVSPKVQDNGVKNNEGKPIAGGQLFRKYLLNRCQEDFERGWMAKETTAAAAASKATEDNAAAKAASEKPKEEEAALYSDEYYAAQKAKRQGLGLIKFIGELFKLQMLTERIMHECVKKLLSSVDNPEEEEIQSLCKLLTSVGGILDMPKARAHMNVYFSRMKELTKGPNVSSRVRYMLIELIELRDRKWVSRTVVTAPTTIAQIHENAAKEKGGADFYNRQDRMSRRSRPGGDHGEFWQVGSDGWAVDSFRAARPPPKAGDLSNFGKVSKIQPMTFGPSSVFAGKQDADAKRESLSPTRSTSNMFSMLSSVHRVAESKSDGSKKEGPAANVPSGKPAGNRDVLQKETKTRIEEYAREFFDSDDSGYCNSYFHDLPTQHHHILIEKLTTIAVEARISAARRLYDFFLRVASQQLCSPTSFEKGFSRIVEEIEDIAVYSPDAHQSLALIISGACLEDERKSKLASKHINPDQFYSLLRSKDISIRFDAQDALSQPKRLFDQQSSPLDQHYKPIGQESVDGNDDQSLGKSCLATALPITDILSLKYPADIRGPSRELNCEANAGQMLRYDRDFLLQFMPFCKNKPANLLPAFYTFCLERTDHYLPRKNRNSLQGQEFVAPISAPFTQISQGQKLGELIDHPALIAAQSVVSAQCFVKGVTESITEHSLQTVLTERFGPIKELDIVRSKACAFIEFESVDSAKCAIIASLKRQQGGEGGVCIGVGSDENQIRITVETKREKSELTARWRGIGFRGGKGRGMGRNGWGTSVASYEGNDEA